MELQMGTNLAWVSSDVPSHAHLHRTRHCQASAFLPLLSRLFYLSCSEDGTRASEEWRLQSIKGNVVLQKKEKKMAFLFQQDNTEAVHTLQSCPENFP